MIPWEANLCSTFLNKTVIFFIIYLFFTSTDCRPIYNATDQVHEQPPLQSPTTSFSSSFINHHHNHHHRNNENRNNYHNNNNNISNNYNFQYQNNTNAIVRVIVTKSSSTSVSAGSNKNHDRNSHEIVRSDEDDDNDQYSSFDHTFPDLSRLFSSTRTTASTITQSTSSSIQHQQQQSQSQYHHEEENEELPEIPNRIQPTSLLTTTTTPRPTTYHPDFFFSPFYSNINRLHPKRKIENRSISKNHASSSGLGAIEQYQNHPDNIFSVFYHAFSQRASPSGSFSFHSQSQQHHGLLNRDGVPTLLPPQPSNPSPPTPANTNYAPNSPVPIRNKPKPQQFFPFHQVFRNPERNPNIENFQSYHTNGNNNIIIPTAPTIMRNHALIDGPDSQSISVVSETRSLTAASTAASLSAETRSISSASTSASSSLAAGIHHGSRQQKQVAVPDKIKGDDPIASALSSEPTSEIYVRSRINPISEGLITPQHQILHNHRVRQTKRLRKSHASQLPQDPDSNKNLEGNSANFQPITPTAANTRDHSPTRSNFQYHRLFSMPSDMPLLNIKQFSPTPEPIINWEQPERVWGKPEMNWGELERDWGKPEMIWGEPEKVWGLPEMSPAKLFKWPSEREAKMTQSQQFQDDPPPPTSTSFSSSTYGGPKIYEITSKVTHNSPNNSPPEFIPPSPAIAERRQDDDDGDIELIDDEIIENGKFYEIGEDEEDEPKELILDKNSMNSTIENAQLAARSWELPELTPSSPLMSPLHHSSSTSSISYSSSQPGGEMTAESIQVSQNINNGHNNNNNAIINANHNENNETNHKLLSDDNNNSNIKNIQVNRSPSSNGNSNNNNYQTESFKKLTDEERDEDSVNEENDFESQKTLENLSSRSIISNTSSISSSSEKPNKKFGYVLDGSDVRKYRVEERTPDGYIVGEYGVINHDNGFLRGVRYTADGTINPRLIHQALMKFLSL